MHLEQLECVGGPMDGDIIAVAHDARIISFNLKKGNINLFDDRIFKDNIKKITYEKRLHKDGKYYLVYVE